MLLVYPCILQNYYKKKKYIKFIMHACAGILKRHGYNTKMMFVQACSVCVSLLRTFSL